MQQSTASLPPDPPDAAQDAVDIDLDRAIWDAEYRSKALAVLKRAREVGPPSQREPPQKPSRKQEQP